MRIGLALPHYDFSFPGGEPVSWERLAEAARRAESLGFDSVWVSDHFFLALTRYGGGPEPQGSVEPLSALAALATVTERVRLGTLVLSTTFRHPAIVAKAASTVDLLSGGRLDLGLGAGWYEDEHRAFGYEFGSVGDRFEILEESVEVIGRLLAADEPLTWRGRRFRLEEAYNRPGPVQKPRPPVIVGGKGGKRLLRLVARHADGWNTVWQWRPDAYGDRVHALREACARAGRDPAEVRLSLGLYTLVGEGRSDLEERFRALRAWSPGDSLADTTIERYAEDRLVGTVDEVLERLSAFARLGVEEMILSAASLPFAVHDWSMLELVADRVIPEARSL